MNWRIGDVWIVSDRTEEAELPVPSRPFSQAETKTEIPSLERGNPKGEAR